MFDTIVSDFYKADEGLQDIKFMSYWLEPVPSFQVVLCNRVVFKVSQKLSFGMGICAPLLTHVECFKERSSGVGTLHEGEVFDFGQETVI